MTIKTTPSNCQFPTCHYNQIAPPEHSQECIGCEGNRKDAPPPPKRCYFILETRVTADGEYIPCIVEEGTKGYYPTTWHWGKDLKVAEHLADEANEKMGISKDEAIHMVLRSMRK